MSEERKDFENQEETNLNSQQNPSQKPQLVAASMPYRVSPSEINAFGVMDDSSYLKIYEKVRTELLIA